MAKQDVIRAAANAAAAGQYGTATRRLLAELKDSPADADLRFALARVYEQTKHYAKAMEIYQSLVTDPKNVPGKLAIGLGNCLIGEGKFAEAEKVLRPVHNAYPANPMAAAALSRCAEHRNDLTEANALLASVGSDNADSVQMVHQRGRLLIAEKDYAQAVDELEKNIDREMPHGDSIDLWIEALKSDKRELYLREKLEHWVKKFPKRPEFVYGLGVTCNRAGDITNARKYLLESLTLLPNNYRVIYDLGVLERQAGEIEQSRSYLKKVLELKPDHCGAIRMYGGDHKYAYADDVFVNLNRQAARITTMNNAEQLQLHFALGKAYDDVGELDSAFAHYEVGGAKKLKLDPYKEGSSNRMAALLKKIVTKNWIDETNQVGSESELPVFILGMPRSGTSLMEQILSSHPDIYGAGELKLMTSAIENISVNQRRLKMGQVEAAFDYDLDASFAQRGDWYAQKLADIPDKPYKRVVDKMPGNFNFVGLIHAILPKAKIIHSRRHPVETCLSCYRILFAEGQLWSYDLSALGRYYRKYWDLMEHWRTEFPDAMYEVRYEDNVADVEGQARSLIAHLGLEWHPNCLDFYNTDRPVKTASASQVRKPIYTTSTNRWRKYERHLKPLLDEIGDIVEAYEAEIAHLAPSA